MRSVLVVIAYILAHQPFQVPFVKHDDMVEQISSAASHPALCNTVLPRASEADPIRLDAETLYGIDHFQVEICAAIKDQIAGSGVVQERIAKMLDDLRFAKAPSVRSLE